MCENSWSLERALRSLGGEGPAVRRRGDEGLAPILGRVTPSVGERVAALFVQPTAALLERHEQGLRLGQVLGSQLAPLDLEGGARDVGGADGNLGAGSRQAHGRDTVPNADLLAA